MKGDILRAEAALALFSDDVIADIYELAGRQNLGMTLANIEDGRRINYPPAIMGAMSDRYCVSDKEAADMAVGLAVLLIYGFKTRGMGANDYQKILVDGLGIDETEAGKWAADINTIDDAQGISASLGYAGATAMRILSGGMINIDPNTKKDDTDALYEVYQLGKVITEKGFPRWRMMSAAYEDAYGASLTTTLKGIESGDVSDVNDLYIGGERLKRVVKAAYCPAPISEMGGPLGDKLKALAKGAVGKLINTATSGLGKTALALLPGGGVASGILSAIGPKPGNNPNVPQPQSAAGVPSYSYTGSRPSDLEVVIRASGDIEEGDVLLGGQ